MSRKQRAAKRKPQQDNTIQFNEYVQRKQNVQLIPRSLNQEEYIDHLLNPKKLMVFASGPAGTGKTMLAVLAALKAFKQGDIDKIVVTRPAVGVDDEKHGFLPGDLNKKMEPWTKPIFDVMEEYYSPKTIGQYLEEGVIEISPLAFMRGRTFKNAFIIADEMQNATPNQMKMLLTRLGEGSQMVVTGDIKQADRRDKDNGLLDFKQLLSGFGKSEYIALTEFVNQDIERHPAVKEVLEIYGDVA